MITNDFLSKILKSQPAQEDYLPKISQHMEVDIVSFKDKKLGFSIRFEGTPFEGVNDQLIVNHFLRLNQTFSVLGKELGNRLALWCTFHRKKMDFNRDYQFSNIFTRSFYEKYMKKFQEDDYFENIFYITVILKYDDLDDGIEEIKDIKEKIIQNLRGYDPYVLKAYKNEQGIWFSEVYEFFGSLINGVSEKIPLSNKNAFTTIASANLHFGSELLEIRAQDTTKYATLYDLKDFGMTKMKVLNPILSLPCEFVFTQSFTYINQVNMQKKIDDQLNKLISVGDLAEFQQIELIEAKGHLSAGELMFGDYHSALVVYGSSPKKAVQNGQVAISRFLNAGGYRFIRSTLSSPATFFSQVPGSTFKPRAFPKATTNLAATFGMYNFAHGKTRGNPLGDGWAVMPLQTQSKTLYDFNFHFTNQDEDNIGEKTAGHTLILGATGTGKTTTQTALLSFTERFDPFIFAVDLDRGMEIFIRALGGSYFSLKSGEPTGLNPFQLPDTPKNREFLYELVASCARDGIKEVTAEEQKIIKDAVDTVMNLDFNNRRFSALMQMIPLSTEDNSLQTRLGIWAESEGGRFAWCLDNPNNLFNPDDFFRIGFDCTDILKPDYRPTEPVLAYLFRLKDLMLEKVAESNGILCTIVEEFWHPARYPMTQELILKSLKTGRKLGEFMLLVSQSPEDAINVPIFSAIIQQTPTKLFLPNPDAEYENSYQRCGLTKKEYQELITLSLDSRTMLVKQSKLSSFVQLDLYGFDHEMAVLSGHSANVLLLDKAIQQCGSDQVDDWLLLFYKMIETQQKNKKSA